MKNVRLISAIAGLSIILASCGTSNNVVSNRLLSKRKYTKGFHLNSKGHYKSSKSQDQEGIDLANVSETEKSVLFSKGDFQSKHVAAVDGKSISSIQSESSATSHVEDAITSHKNEVDKASRAEEIVLKDSNTEKIGHFTKAELKRALKGSSNTPAPIDDTAMLIILVILAIIIPPLAVFIYEGATSRFWIDLILAIIGWGIGYWLLGGLGFLCGLAAVIYALLIVLEAI